jgi:Family of unknown function (DUF6011)
MSTPIDTNGQLFSAPEIRRYVLGGNSAFTIVKPDGDRYTYRVRSNKIDRDANWSAKNQDRSLFFVSVLSGPDNYTYLGVLRLDAINGEYLFRRTAKSPSGSTPSGMLFDKLWISLEIQCRMLLGHAFWHEGSCCVCGRKLTVPESIANGIGPECMSNLGG